MSEIDISAVRRSLASVDLNGFVALIDYLVQCQKEGEEVAKIGTATINDTGKLVNKLTPTDILHMPSFCLGRLDGKMTALEELAEKSQGFIENKDTPNVRILDQVCTDLCERDDRKWKIIIGRYEILRQRTAH